MKISFGFAKELEIKVILPKNDIQGAVDIIKKVDISQNILTSLEQSKQQQNGSK